MLDVLEAAGEPGRSCEAFRDVFSSLEASFSREGASSTLALLASPGRTRCAGRLGLRQTLASSSERSVLTLKYPSCSGSAILCPAASHLGLFALNHAVPSPRFTGLLSALSRRQSAGAVVGWMFFLVTRWCSDSAGVCAAPYRISAASRRRDISLHPKVFLRISLHPKVFLRKSIFFEQKT